jgi:hypothetical protein
VGDHVHTGFYAFLFAGGSAVVMIWLLRFLAAWLVDHGFESIGKPLGALVQFS